MNGFDKLVKRKAQAEQADVPEFISCKIEQTLNELPKQKTSLHALRGFSRVAAAAVFLLFTALVLFPNISTAYAQAMEQIPVIGDIVRVVTIRNYFYSDGNHEMNVEVPYIEGDRVKGIDHINNDINKLATVLAEQFYKELEISGGSGYGSTYADYEVVTDTENWFTLKISVSEIAASSNNYFKFYHIDKRDGKLITLGDLFTTENYSQILTDEIKRQMREQMAADETVVFWVDSEMPDADFVSIERDQSFYLNEKGELVIVFDKYEVAPGSMGTPEFVIGKDVFSDILKKEFTDVVS